MTGEAGIGRLPSATIWQSGGLTSDLSGRLGTSPVTAQASLSTRDRQPRPDVGRRSELRDCLVSCFGGPGSRLAASYRSALAVRAVERMPLVHAWNKTGPFHASLGIAVSVPEGFAVRRLPWFQETIHDVLQPSRQSAAFEQFGGCRGAVR